MCQTPVECFVSKYPPPLGRLTRWLKGLNHDAHSDTMCNSGTFDHREKKSLGANIHRSDSPPEVIVSKKLI